MSQIIQWNSGLFNYKKHMLIDNNFITLLTESEYELGRNINEIFYDHLSQANGKIELLYSGGLDSELVLRSCIANKIPVELMTMVIKLKGAVVNVVDLYYSEKFCRENNLKQNFFTLDAYEFYESGRYLEYLLPYKINEPHVASHFWLIEHCHSFPVLGGDWPWVHAHRKDKILSPFKIDYSSYERFMEDKKISGIGNMISHSFESSVYFIKKYLQHYTIGCDELYSLAFIKNKMYDIVEPRIKTYGWEQCPTVLFDMKKYKDELIKRNKSVNNKIIWGQKISEIIDSKVRESTLFR